METYFKELCDEVHIEISEKQIEKFFKYKDLLVEKNKYVNLTAITDEKEILLKHFVDSLTINKYLDNDVSMIDVGTGAGFPGIPIKIIRDDVKVTLLDSLNKRVNFLNEVIENLKLNSISAVHGRAEDLAHDLKYREMFDVVTARAVANLATLSELCLPFVKVRGRFICMKGSSVEEVDEASKALEILGGKIVGIDKFVLPDSDIERNIVIIEKIKGTSNKYPRKAGTPAKEPLK